jgi:RNA polymerase sigma-70 factor, ECF subfamily
MERKEASLTAERVARDSYGRLLAFLAARTRDIAGAEDALAEAFATALVQWPKSGVPDNPDAWLLTVARRRQTDALRRRTTQLEGETHMRLILDELAAGPEHDIPDQRLALMFACAHPAIDRGMRAPLILQTILGFNAVEIAANVLVSPTTMGQRLVRAKSRLKLAGIPFKVPDRHDLPERLDAVLDAVYAVYTKGWTDIRDRASAGHAEEAIWLARLIVGLLPEAPETKGLLALMLYAEARRAARRDPSGAYVPLEEQDTSLWDSWQIDIAENLLPEANALGESGRFQIEAAIQSAHCARLRAGTPTWPAIATLYDHLLRLTDSPVVLLNRAMALAETQGLDAALLSIAQLETDRRMLDYQPYWAARGHLLARAGQIAGARDALTLALGLADDDAVRAYLHGQIQRLGSPA